jgi:hypothetical protein
MQEWLNTIVFSIYIDCITHLNNQDDLMMKPLDPQNKTILILGSHVIYTSFEILSVQAVNAPPASSALSSSPAIPNS